MWVNKSTLGAGTAALIGLSLASPGATAASTGPSAGSISDSPSWISVATGVSHTCAIKKNKTLWCWGFNDHGQLGVGDTIVRNKPVKVGDQENWVTIAAVGDHTCGLKTNDALWCWGSNETGELGL